MASFLLFDGGGRLCRVSNVPGGYRAIPMEMVFGDESTRQGLRAMELHPSFLAKFRPQILQKLVGHCTFDEGELVVDSLEDIQRRFEKMTREGMGRELVAVAREIVGIGEAEKLLGFLPACERERQKVLRVELERLSDTLAKMSEGLIQVDIDPEVVALSEQRIPL